MKKNYIAPLTITVKVKTEVMLGSNSTEYLRGVASSSAVGMSRESHDTSDWDDEE